MDNLFSCFKKLLEIGVNGNNGVFAQLLVMEGLRQEQESVMILLQLMEEPLVMEMRSRRSPVTLKLVLLMEIGEDGAPGTSAQ